MLLLLITLIFPFMLPAADKQDIQSHHVTITTHNESRKIPLHVAQLSFFMRNYMQQPIFAQTNVISLDFQGKPLQDTFELKLLIPFLMQAEETLIAKPISSQGSYVQLAHKEPLASANDPEKLLKLFIACDFLQFDFNQSQDFDHKAIIKAIALKMTKLNTNHEKPLSILEAATQKMVAPGINTSDQQDCYNVEELVWPYILTQSYLTTKKIPDDHNFIINFRDILAHECKITLIHFGCYLQNHHLRSLHGIMQVPNIQFITVLNLCNNAIIGLPDLKLPYLRTLHLSNNQINSWPTLNFPLLEDLFLSYNQITTIGYNHHVPSLKYLWLLFNKIEKLPDNLNMPSLTALNLEKNPIATVPESMKRPELFIFLDKKS